MLSYGPYNLFRFMPVKQGVKVNGRFTHFTQFNRISFCHCLPSKSFKPPLNKVFQSFAQVYQCAHFVLSPLGHRTGDGTLFDRHPDAHERHR